MQLKKNNRFWAGVLFVATFLLALFGFASFTFLNHADAEGAAAQLSLGVSEVISIAIDADNVSFNLTPEFADTKSGTFGMSSTVVKVYTNSDGYKLYMSNKDSNNALSHTKSSIADQISSLSVATVGIDSTDSTDAFPTNSWGYSLDTGESKVYSAIPTSTVLLKSATLLTASEYAAITDANRPDTSTFTDTNGPDSNKSQTTDSEDYDKLISTTVTFGAKVDTSIASGTYSDVVVFDVTGSNVGPEAPGVSTSSYLWTQTATTSIEDVSPSHPITEYQYYIIKSDKAYSTTDEDLVADAAAKAPNTSTTPTGSLTPAENAGTYSSQLVLSGDAGTSTTGVAYTDGIYYVYARSVDDSDKRSNWATAEIIKLDNTAPSAPEITRTGYNTFSFASTDNVSTTKYITVPCVTSESMSYAQCVASASTPSLSDPSWSTSLSQTISSANTQAWFVYARDEAGNISSYSTAESFKVTLSSTNTSMAAKYESASGTAISLDANPKTIYVLNNTPIYVSATANSGYTNFALTWNGAAFTSGNVGTVTANTAIIASASTTAPADLEVHRNAYNQIGYSATDDVAVTGYYVTSTALGASAPANPSATAGDCASANTSNCWSTNTTFTITGAGTWYVWAKDGTGNVTGPVSIDAYTISQGTNSNASSSAKYDSTTGTAWSASNNFALSGTTLYVSGSANSGFNITGIYCGSTSGTTSPQSCTISGNTTFYATAADQTAPGAVTFSQTAYNVVTLSATDDSSNVTGFYISTSNSTPSATATGWTTPTSTGKTSTYSYTFSSAGTYYFWAKDANNNVSAVSSKTAHTLTISPTLSTINVQYTNASGAYVAQSITSSTTRVVIDGTALYVKASASTNYTLATATFNGTSILSSVASGYSGTMSSANMTIAVTSTDQTAPSMVTVTRVSASATQFTMSATDSVGVTGYYVSKDSTTAPAASASACSGANTTGCWYTSTSFTISSAGTYRAWAKDAAGNVSASAGSIVAYTVYNYSSPNTTLVVRLVDSSGTSISEGSNSVALSGTPIYISATADGGYSLSYVCTSTSTTACSSTNITNNSTTTLSNNMYVFASSASAGISDGAYMQDVTSTMCNNMTQTNTVVALTDRRDNKVYQVKKLADGNCWMTQNLGTVGGTALNTTYSNVSYTLPSSSTSFGTSNTAVKMYNGSHSNNSASSIGAYYNARVANALTASETVSAKDYGPKTDICPKGWTLPTYSQQRTLANSSSTYYTPYNPVLAGYYYSSSLYYSGSSGDWWSRTAYSSADFYYLSAHSSSLNTTIYNIRNGPSVRCVVAA